MTRARRVYITYVLDCITPWEQRNQNTLSPPFLNPVKQRFTCFSLPASQNQYRISNHWHSSRSHSFCVQEYFSFRVGNITNRCPFYNIPHPSIAPAKITSSCKNTFEWLNSQNTSNIDSQWTSHSFHLFSSIMMMLLIKNSSHPPFPYVSSITIQRVSQYLCKSNDIQRPSELHTLLPHLTYQHSVYTFLGKPITNFPSIQAEKQYSIMGSWMGILTFSNIKSARCPWHATKNLTMRNREAGVKLNTQVNGWWPPEKIKSIAPTYRTLGVIYSSYQSAVPKRRLCRGPNPAKMISE